VGFGHLTITDVRTITKFLLYSLLTSPDCRPSQVIDHLVGLRPTSGLTTESAPLLVNVKLTDRPSSGPMTIPH
jgi:hypothetical protein